MSTETRRFELTIIAPIIVEVDKVLLATGAPLHQIIHSHAKVLQKQLAEMSNPPYFYRELL